MAQLSGSLTSARDAGGPRAGGSRLQMPNWMRVAVPGGEAIAPVGNVSIAIAGGATATIPGGVYATVSGSPALAVTTTHYITYVTTAAPSVLLACKQQDFAAIYAAQDVAAIGYHTDQYDIRMPGPLQSCLSGLNPASPGSFERAYDAASVLIGVGVSVGSTVGPTIAFPTQITLFPAGFTGGTLNIIVAPSGTVVLCNPAGVQPSGVNVGTVTANQRIDDIWHNYGETAGYTTYVAGGPAQSVVPPSILGAVGPLVDLRLINTPLSYFYAYPIRWVHNAPDPNIAGYFYAGAAGVLYGPGPPGGPVGGVCNGITTQGLAPFGSSPSWANRWCGLNLHLNGGRGLNDNSDSTYGYFYPYTPPNANVYGPGPTTVDTLSNIVTGTINYGSSTDPTLSHISGLYGLGSNYKGYFGFTDFNWSCGPTFSVTLVRGTCPP